MRLMRDIKVLKTLLLIVFASIVTSSVAQKNLQITKFSFKKQKIHRVFVGERLVYKLKGDVFWKKGMIVNLQDSMVIFADDTHAKLNEFKKFRLFKNVHLAQTVQHFFIGLGFGFFPLNTFNQIITNHEPILSPTAAIISVGLLGSSLIFRELNFKRIRVNKRTVLLITETGFQNLNVK